jgi:hypothetical protein
MDLATIRSFISLGFGHITAPGALDHILFLLALAAIYRWSEWRQALVVVTAFTVGHSITLALAVLRPGALPSSEIVEFLIPLTILATGIENIVTRGVKERRIRMGRRVALAGAFGLVHGAGFAGYLTELMSGSIAAPLFGFNVGIEIGQILVLTVAFVVFSIIDRAVNAIVTRSPLPAARGPLPGFRLRVSAISLMIATMGLVWAVERAPW